MKCVQFTPEHLMDIREALIVNATTLGLYNSHSCWNFDRAMTWSSTPQGRDFWSPIHTMTRKLLPSDNYGPPIIMKEFEGEIMLGMPKNYRQNEDRPLL